MNRFLKMVAFAFLVMSLFSSGASADVRHQGTWEADKRISIDAKHVGRTEALERLAKEAGWSVVFRGIDDGQPFDLHIVDQPADKVLDVVLGEGDFVADRDGTLITIHGSPQKTASAPTSAPAAVVASPRGEDRVMHGGNLVVGADETVHDVTMFGGSASIYGTATGNVTVFGGSANVKKGAHVYGNTTAVGGSIDIADGAQVDGDVGVVAGSLDRHKGSKIGGNMRKSDEIAVGASSSASPRSLLRAASDATTRAAMLFVFGAVLFALAGNRMNALRVEAASRPMRSFALGLVGSLIGLIAVAIIAITVVGIPVAAVLALGGVFAGFAGVCAVLATVGKALVGHKTDNPHLHLLVGCALFLVSGAITFVSGLVTLAVMMTGMGVVFATRGAGTFGGGRPGAPSSGPYRTDATLA